MKPRVGDIQHARRNFTVGLAAQIGYAVLGDHDIAQMTGYGRVGIAHPYIGTQSPFALPRATHLDDGSAVFQGVGHTDKIELVYGTTGNSYYLDSLDDIPSGFWEPSSIHLETVSKFKKLTERYSIYDLMRNYSGSGYAVSTPRVCGHANFVSTPRVCGNQTNKAEDFVSYDFYTFFYRNSDILTLDKKNKLFQVSSKEERDSLISYLKTKVARFGLSICKVSQDGHIKRYLNNVPLPPLDREWTEESIMDYYDFTEEQRNLINTFIHDYYNV